MMADLDFRARTATDDDGSVGGTLGTVQLELRQVDLDIAGRYFGTPAQPAARPLLA
jgi:hypothetical protein